MPDNDPPLQNERTPDNMMGLLTIALKNFGKDVVIALVFSVVLGMAGRQIYRDLIASNSTVISIAQERAKNDEELSRALLELSKQVEGTNAVIAERVREMREADRREADRRAEERSPNPK